MKDGDYVIRCEHCRKILGISVGFGSAGAVVSFNDDPPQEDVVALMLAGRYSDIGVCMSCIRVG
jgi:hypothetical protein